MIGAVLMKRSARQAFAAMNRRDLAAFMKVWADDAVFDFPSAFGGHFEGRAEIEGWFRRWWQQVADIRFQVRHVAVEDIAALGGTNAATIEWELVERDLEGRSYRLQGVTAVEARGGRIVRARDYIFDTAPILELWGGSTTAAAAAEPPGEPVLAGR